MPRHSMPLLLWLRVWLGYGLMKSSCHHCGISTIWLGIAYRICQFQLPFGATGLPSRSRRYCSTIYLCVSAAHARVLAANRGALNLGLKDQLAALEWVQANIESFGGDKDKVIFSNGTFSSMARTLMISRSPYLEKVLVQSCQQYSSWMRVLQLKSWLEQL